ncbi:MAG: aspartate 1-decarboxylase [Verrucomicrobia bacterium]|nr:aspartate 1-decarboxylase [Verrucomicrobiota bacterium]
MQIELLKSKIHRATVTDSHVDYEGSLTIDLDLIEMSGMFVYEKILCSNMANGARFETYVIPGERGKKQIVLNGAAAHLGARGDRLTIMSFVRLDMDLASTWQPKVLVLDQLNNIKATRS